jgi:hypothetical protein
VVARWALTILGLAILVWLDQFLRQAARPELVVLCGHHRHSTTKALEPHQPPEGADAG